LNLYRALAQRNLDAYLLNLAAAINNLGVLHKNEKRMNDFVAAIVNNLGFLHNDENRMADARAAHEEALKIYRNLAQQNPESICLM
jgi:hypothetical protein